MFAVIYRPIACLVLAGSIFAPWPVIADPGLAPESRSSRLQPSDRSVTELLEHQTSRAELWGLEEGEWQRYRTLMQGIRGSVSPSSLSPIEVLGIHARNNSERRRYAEQWARMMREDTERILAFQRAYDEAQQRLYPDSIRIDPGALAAQAPAVDLAGTFSLESGDRILFFTETHCAGCDAVLERMLARIHQFSGLDLYLVDVSSGEESRIREWAVARQIDPQWVREHRITLNIDAGALERVLAHTGLSDADLPVLVRKRGNQLTLLPPSRF